MNDYIIGLVEDAEFNIDEIVRGIDEFKNDIEKIKEKIEEEERTKLYEEINNMRITINHIVPLSIYTTIVDNTTTNLVLNFAKDSNNKHNEYIGVLVFEPCRTKDIVLSSNDFTDGSEIDCKYYDNTIKNLKISINWDKVHCLSYTFKDGLFTAHIF